MVVLRRPTPSERRRPWASPDPVQAAVAAHRGGVAVVVGAPGTGKTTAALETVAARVADGAPADACLLLCGSRVAAAAQRERLSSWLGATGTQPLARTPSSVAFGILRRQAVLEGLAPPRLLSGPEQDAILRELLAGHEAGDAPRPGWPEGLGAALTTRGFRAELRDLLMRAAERGLTPADLAELGRRADQPQWVAAARVAAEYEQVTALSRPGGFDPAALLAAAGEALDDEPDMLAQALPGLALVVVDDAQELTPPGLRLVRQLVGDGADLVLIGDPDSATQTFRGGDPAGFVDLEAGAARFTLPTRHRHARAVAAVTAAVAQRIGTLGPVPQRQAAAGRADEGRARTLLARSGAQEARLVAEHLRRAHLLDGVPWAQMAVIVRGGARTATLRRVLQGEGVPVTLPGAHVPLRQEGVVEAVMTLLTAAVRQAEGAPAPLDGEGVSALLLSPLAGYDAISLRRLRRALRTADAESGRSRSTEEALLAAVLGETDPAPGGPDAAGVRRLARALRAGREAARRGEGGWEPGVTAETVLWALWSGLGVADEWKRTALGGGPGAARADRDLDAMVALFEAAAGYVDRLPGRGPDGFIEHLQGQDVAGDMLADRAPVGDAVVITTPAGAAGLEWDVVAVCGVQEGVWPDLRLRGSVLGSSRLVDELAGRSGGTRAALAAVRHDEARLFHVAVSRARRDLLVTAVANEDDQPSPFVDLVSAAAGASVEQARVVTAAVGAMSLGGAVALARRQLAAPASAEGAEAAARRLAWLAAEGVAGADPARWWALTPASDVRPRRGPGAAVRVSPSRVESFEQCGLRWLLTASGGEAPRAGGADAVGTLVHAIAAEVDNGDVAAMHDELDRRWPEVGLPEGWISRRRRAQAAQMLTKLAAYHTESRGQGWQVVGREVPGSLSLGRAEVRGRVDRLERDEQGRLRVIDLKTGSSKRRAADLPRLPQLGVYQVLTQRGAFEVGFDEGQRGAGPAPAGEAGRDPEGQDRGGQGETGQGQAEKGRAGDPPGSAGAALLQLGGKTVAHDLQLQPPLAGDDDPEWAERLILDSAEGMAAATVTARVGDWCRMCAGRACCPLSGDGETI